MMWDDIADWEPAQIVGGDPIQVAVHEDPPTANLARPGETGQAVTLLLRDRVRLNPPTRIVVRGHEMRVLGSVVGPPWATTLVTCERIHPDLPDTVTVLRAGHPIFDDVSGRYTVTEVAVWSGPAHVQGASPAVVDSAGERAPLDRVEIVLPLDATVAPDLVVRVDHTRHPSKTGARYRVGGEIDSSTAALRRVIGYRLEG